MTNAGKSANFGHPNTIKFRIGSQAIVVIVSDFTVCSLIRVKAKITFSLCKRIIRIPPRRSSPVTRECSPWSNVDNIKKAARIIKRIGSRITDVICRRIFVLQRITIAAHEVVESIREVVVELFQERLERAVFGSNFIFVEFKIEKRTTLAILDIGQIAFEHARREIVVLRDLNRQTLVISELSRIRKRGVSLLVQNRAGLKRIVFTNAPVAHKRALTTQRVFGIRSQVLVMREFNIVATVAKVKFFKIARVFQITI